MNRIHKIVLTAMKQSLKASIPKINDVDDQYTTQHRKKSRYTRDFSFVTPHSIKKKRSMSKFSKLYPLLFVK